MRGGPGKRGQGRSAAMSTRVLALMLGFTVAAVGSSTRTSPATAGTRRGLVSVQVTRASAQQLTTRGTPRAARAAQLDTEAEVSNAGRFVSRTLTPQFARESNFATFAVQSAGATATATQRANRFGARSAEDVASMRTNLLFEDERRRQQLRQRVVDAELELARSATFYFDIGEARDGLTVQLGRPPAFFELAKALHKMGHSVTPSMLVQREKEGMRAINKLFLDNHRIVSAWSPLARACMRPRCCSARWSATSPCGGAWPCRSCWPAMPHARRASRKASPHRFCAPPA